MKKVIMFLILAVIMASMSAVFTSCSSDDDEPDRYSNIARVIEIKKYVGYDFKVEDYRSEDIFVSDNPFVATAENGIITLKHVGEATVTHNKKTYQITSTPTRLYNEPLLNFGASKGDVVEFEKRKLKSADGDNLVYEGDGNYIIGVAYRFDDKGKLYNVYLIFNHFDGLWDYYWKERLNQRYGIADETDDSIVYLNNEPKKADIMVIYTPNMKGYSNYGSIIYAPYK